jgi:diphthine-ammonia ligase
MDGRKFVASYSGGKDCMLAIHRAMASGLKPVAFIIMHNEARQRSWFHGITEVGIEQVSQAVGVPIWLIKTEGPAYTENFERALIKAREAGAEVCVFGDIDVQAHHDWCTARCAATGLEALFPLWGESRKSVVYELIDAGFKARITVIDLERMDGRFLGQTLTRELADQIEAEGADICGENGEYHTFVYDGPMFLHPVNLPFGSPVTEKNRLILPVNA